MDRIGLKSILDDKNKKDMFIIDNYDGVQKNNYNPYRDHKNKNNIDANDNTEHMVLEYDSPDESSDSSDIEDLLIETIISDTSSFDYSQLSYKFLGVNPQY